MFDCFEILGPYVLLTVLLAISLTGMLTSKPRVHAVPCLAWTCATLGYSVFIPIMSRIVGH